MRLTMRTNLAMRTLMLCAANPGQIVRKHEIAGTFNASENHLAQVVHMLGQTGYLHTQRGRAGGMTLARAPELITVGQIFRTFEASLPFAECFSTEENLCLLASCCKLKCLLSEALEAFYAKLDAVTLADLMEDNAALENLLKIAA